MHETCILCSDCGNQLPLGFRDCRCPSCGSSLEVDYDYPKLRKRLSLSLLRSRPFSHARYRELFPVRRLLSLGEGGTPLLRSRNLERELGINSQLWFKLESQNPTGSFKDRGSSVEVARALESRAGSSSGEQSPRKGRGVVVASTGNMGASVSAYCAIAGLGCTVFTPSDVRVSKVNQMLAYGARVLRVRGSYADAAGLAERACAEHGFSLLGDYLFRREGTKSVGYELADQMPGLTHVFCPVGNGTLISATWKAFREWRRLGLSRGLPRLAGIQASGCSPVTRAVKRSGEIRPGKCSTIAGAIECGEPLDGKRAVSSIIGSGGLAGAVTDREILRARELLARREGIFAEPAGACALAGLIKARKALPKSSRIACLVTGHGLKTPKTPVRGRPETIPRNPDLGKLFA